MKPEIFKSGNCSVNSKGTDNAATVTSNWFVSPFFSFSHIEKKNGKGESHIIDVFRNTEVKILVF